MPIASRVEGGSAIVTISGRLTLGREIERLETAVRDLLQQGQKRFILDLSELDYIDSSGIGAVVSSLTEVKKAGGDLRLAGTNPRLQKMFKMTGVDAIVAMFPTVAEASAS